MLIKEVSEIKTAKNGKKYQILTCENDKGKEFKTTTITLDIQNYHAYKYNKSLAHPE